MSSEIYETPEAALRAVAPHFHQDFNETEDITFADALDAIWRGLEPHEREAIVPRLEEALRKYPDDASFDDVFIRVGAESWPKGVSARSEVEAMVQGLRVGQRPKEHEGPVWKPPSFVRVNLTKPSGS